MDPLSQLTEMLDRFGMTAVAAVCILMLCWLVRYVVTQFGAMNLSVVNALNAVALAVQGLTDHVKSDDRDLKDTVEGQWETLNSIKSDTAILLDRRSAKRPEPEKKVIGK